MTQVAVSYIDSVETYSGTNADIISVVEKNFYPARDSVKEFAKQFAGGSKLQTAQNVWSYLKNNIQYKADGSFHQKVKLPGRLIADGVGDCKSFSLFAASILSYYGNVSFRYTSYSSDPTPSHVYVIFNDNIIVDAVWHSFNSQKSYTHKLDHKMKISTLSGLPMDTATQDQIITRIKYWRKRLDDYTPGTPQSEAIINRIRRLKDGIIDQDNAIGKVAKPSGKRSAAGQIALAPGRNAYLELVKLNYRGIANRLQKAIQKDASKVKDKWQAKLGGNYNRLVDAVNKGATKKPFLGDKKVNGIGFVFATLLSAAAPVVLSISGLLKSLGLKNQDDTTMETDTTNAAGSNTNADDLDISDKGSGEDHDHKGIPPILILAVGGFVAAKIFKLI